jgi:hypothetical protein
MPEPREPFEARRPNLGDLMILIAAAAAGLALHRSSASRWANDGSKVIDSKLYMQLQDVVALDVVPPLIAATFCVAAIRLRRPRPPLARLVDLPGAAAVLSASMALGVGYAGFLIQRASGSCPAFFTDPALPHDHLAAGWAVAGAWSMSLLGGRWRTGRTWIDRIGIGVGFAWLGIVLMALASPLLTR